MQHTQDERLGLASASGMPRIFNCPGSFRKEAEAGEEIPSAESQEGSEIAAALEQMNTESLDEDQKTIADHLLVMESRAVEKWKLELGVTGKIVYRREERLWIKRRSTGEPMASAKPDFFVIAGENAIVINHKTGYLPVPHASVSPQVRCEALAIWHEFPQVKRVRGALARYRFREDFSATDYNLSDLQFAEHELSLHLWRAGQDGAVVQAGEHCRYCRAKGTCKAAAAWSLLPSVEVGTLAAQKLGVPINLEHCLAAVDSLTLQQMAFMHGNSGVISKILEAIKVKLKGMPDDTLQSIGLRKTAPGQLRQLPEVGKVWEWVWLQLNTLLPEAQQIQMTEFQAVCKASVGSLQDLVADRIQKRDGGTKKDAEAKAKKLLEQIVTIAQTEPKLLKL